MADVKRVNVDRFLRVVLAVAEARQITLAAERLGMAQPWVSRQIQEVEGEVGVKLFKRIHGGVETTPSGDVFVEEITHAVLHIERSISRARAASASVTDRLLIGISPTFDPDLSDQLQACLRSTLSGMELAFDSRFVSEQVEDILRTDLHMGLAELPIRAEGLRVSLLRRVPMLIAGGRGEPLLAASTLDAGNLNRKPCVILASQKNPSQERLVAFLRKRGMRAENIREVLTVPEALHHVTRGKAYAVVPPLATKLRYDGVIFRQMNGFHIDYGVIFHQDHRNAAIRTLLSAVQQCCSADRTAIQSQGNGGKRQQKTIAC
jgi:DNA-binding transcriptional LysR family regulator